MTDVPALVVMCPLPTARAVAVAKGQEAAERASHKVNGLVVMTAYGRALVLGECKPALVKDVKGTAAVSTSVLPACLSKVVEESGHCNAV